MSTASILYRVRRMLGDMGTPFTMGAAADGAVAKFDLDAAPVEPSSIVVMTTTTKGAIWDGPLVLGSQFVLDSYNGKILFATPPPLGTYIAVQGLQYIDWTDIDCTDFIEIAFQQHTYHRNPHVYLDAVSGAIPPTQVLPQVEENLVAMLAVIEAYWALATSKAQNFTIDTGDGTVIPLPAQYEHIMSHIDRMTARYERMSNLLNVGLYAIEIADLRRVSRITGCLVPLYQDQEIEERWHPPDRALPAISQKANVMIHYAGMWNPNVPYKINDEVVYGGWTYVALANNTNVNPGSDTQSRDGYVGANWKLTTVNDMGGYWAASTW